MGNTNYTFSVGKLKNELKDILLEDQVEKDDKIDS